MNYTISSLNSFTRKLVFDMQAREISQHIDMALVEKQKTTSLKGFRKGKAPLKLIDSLYRSQMTAGALANFARGQLAQAIRAEGLAPVAPPQLGEISFDASERVTFEAMVEVFPPVEIQDLKNVHLEHRVDEVSQEEVEKLKKSHLRSLADTIGPVEDPMAVVEQGLFVTVKIDGPTGGEYLLEVGGSQKELSQRCPDVFPIDEEKLIGMKVGESQVLPGPVDIEILEIKEKKLPVPTDQWAQDQGLGDLANWEARLKAILTNEKRRNAEEALNLRIVEKLVEMHPCEVPPSILSKHEKILQGELDQSVPEEEQNNFFREHQSQISQSVEQRARWEILSESLAEKFQIEIHPSDAYEELQRQCQAAHMDPGPVQEAYRKNPVLMEGLMFQLRAAAILEKLKEHIDLKRS